MDYQKPVLSKGEFQNEQKQGKSSISDRESMSREAYDSLIPDPTMAREGLREYIEPHVFG